MRVLSVIHEPGAMGGGGAYEHHAVARGDELTVWLPPDGSPAPSAATAFDAIMVFGGIAHPDQDAEHPWLTSEVAFVAEAIESGVPLLGVCLGSQLIARAAGTWVGPAQVAEVGWHPVSLTEAAAADPVVGAAFPERFLALEWHYYTWKLPAGAELLAANDNALQAYRLGERTWAVQFHPEVTPEMLDYWCETGAAELPTSLEGMREQNAEHLPLWSRQGTALVEAFLQQAGTPA